MASCQQLPLTPEDIQARKFEAVPGKGVIYMVRDSPDWTEVQAQIYFGGKVLLKTYPGTYYRWEVPPGEHRIAGSLSDTGAITVDAAPGKIYFVQQRVTGLMGSPHSFFSMVNEVAGRAAVMRSVLLVPDK